MQTGVTVSGNAITGELKFIEGGLATSGPLAGDGYFLALHWSDPAEDIESLLVGLDPSNGSGLVECISDTDRNGVFKVADGSIDLATQKLKIVQTKGTQVHTQQFSLAGLTLEEHV